MNKKVEIWKDIKGYEGLYQISNFGRVKSFCLNKKGKIRALSTFSTGYVYVGLSRNALTKHHLVSILVAEHFIPNPENKKFVNHKDGNKKNNRFYNLEWSTQSENTKHSMYTLGNINDYGIKPVNQIDLRTGNVIKNFPSQNEASKTTNISQSAISKCCLGKRKSAGGYGWKFAERDKKAQKKYEEKVKRLKEQKERGTIEKINELYKELGSYVKVAKALKVNPQYIKYVRNKAKVDNK